MSQLAVALKKFYTRKNKIICFSNGMTLNSLAMEMWTQLNFKGIDASVLSRVINGKRFFTYKQLRVFCDILGIQQSERNFLFGALTKDLISKSGINPEQYIQVSLNDILYRPIKFDKTIESIINNSSAEMRFFFTNISSNIIPGNNQTSIIGIQFNQKSYYYLIDKGVEGLNPLLEPYFSGIDVSIPSCGFNKTVAGLENNCRCGYHLALFGIIKQLLKKQIITKEPIEKEIQKWVAYFFPKETLINYLEHYPLQNLQAQQLLDNLKSASKN